MKKAELISKLDTMLDKEFKPVLPTEEDLTIALLANIPLLRGILRNANAANLAIGRLVEASSNVITNVRKNAQGLQIAGAVFDSLNFIRIPFIYLFAYLAGQRPPFTLSKTVQWLYAALLLALTITVFAIPPVAPVLAIATASIILFADLFIFGKLLYERSKLKKAIANSQTGANEQSLSDLRAEIAALRAKVEEDGLNDEALKTYADLESRYTKLASTYQANLNKLAYNSLLLSKMNKMHHLEKTLTVVFSTVGLIGAVLVLSFPPVGLWIMAAAGIAGGIFILSRLAASLYNTLKSKTKTAPSNKPPPEIEFTVLKPLKKLGLTAEKQADIENPASLEIKSEKSQQESPEIEEPEHSHDDEPPRANFNSR